MIRCIIGVLAVTLLLSPCKGFGETPSPEKIIEWFWSAQQGDAKAQSNIGWMYYKGQGAPQDYTIALKWFRLAAQQDYAPAQYNLGVMYIKGAGVLRDDSEALRWFLVAAQQDYAPAQFNIGWIYEKSIEVPQDYTEALKWYRLAAQQEDAEVRSAAQQALKRLGEN